VDALRSKSFLLLSFAAAALSVPSIAGAATGAQVWAQAGCGGCHTLQAAGSTGNAGPNLDDLHPPSAVVAAQVTYGGGGMPAFGGSLSPSDIRALATWVASSTGGGASSPTAPVSPTAPTSPTAAAAVSHLSKRTVRRIQTELTGLGFFNGPVTGFYGPLTTAAVKAFQQAAGLTADGVWGPMTSSAVAAALSPSASSGGTPTNLTTTEVRTLQTDLMRLGYFHGPITGFYGPLTTAAVKRFQAAKGLKPDGVWGHRSQAALGVRL
jgi:peptidoglycan hydrolase-like protein with peptidoglycan-binding domain